MAQAVTAAQDARLGRELRQIVLKEKTLFARIVGLALIIRIPREWKPAKGMLLNFKEKDPDMFRTATSYMHTIFNKHHKVSPRTCTVTQLQYRL